MSKMRNYVCVQKTVVRSGFDMDSDEAGVLSVGSVITPQRKQVNENGIARIKFAQGWVSLVTGDGDKIMEPTELPPTDIALAASTPAPAPVAKVDASDNARSRWSLPGAGPAAATDEFADTDSTVESISIAGKVVDAGDKPAQSDAVGSLTPVASCTVVGAVQVPGVDGEKDYTAYLVECTGLTGETWVTAKRFSDFEGLRDELVALGLTEVGGWAFPGKMTFFKSDEEVQAERVSGFGSWLSLVLKRGEVNSADEKAVLMFFRPDTTPIAAAAAEPSADRPMTPLSESPAAVEELLGEYMCVKKTVVRTGFEMESDKAEPSILKKGTAVVATEARRNEAGILRVKFGEAAWVSATSSAGDVILEKVTAAPAPAPAPTPAPAPAPAPVAAASEAAVEEEVIGAYTVVLKSVVRAGFEMDSEKVGIVKKGEEVLCYEERENEKGVTRVRFDRGWVSLTSSDGAAILEAVE